MSPLAKPEPPDYLSIESAREWVKICRPLPHDWFTEEMWPVLACHCQNIVTLKRITKELNSQNDIHGRIFANLSRLQMQYADLVSRIATKLRLTPQSRHAVSDSKRANKEAGLELRGKVPWSDAA
jgi:phage terminase small subunit